MGNTSNIPPIIKFILNKHYNLQIYQNHSRLRYWSTLILIILASYMSLVFVFTYSNVYLLNYSTFTPPPTSIGNSKKIDDDTLLKDPSSSYGLTYTNQDHVVDKTYYYRFLRWKNVLWPINSSTNDKSGHENIEQTVLVSENVSQKSTQKLNDNIENKTDDNNIMTSSSLKSMLLSESGLDSKLFFELNTIDLRKSEKRDKSLPKVDDVKLVASLLQYLNNASLKKVNLKHENKNKSNKSDPVTWVRFPNRSNIILKNLSTKLSLWPEDNPTIDRIENQLKILPQDIGLTESQANQCLNLNKLKRFGSHHIGSTKGHAQPKLIHVETGLKSAWPTIDYGCGYFHQANCSFRNCYLTDWNDAKLQKTLGKTKKIFTMFDQFRRSGKYLNTWADLALWRHASVFKRLVLERNALSGAKNGFDQIWVWHSLESPPNMPLTPAGVFSYNWTATYKLDSDLVTPYAKYKAPKSMDPLLTQYRRLKPQEIEMVIDNFKTKYNVSALGFNLNLSNTANNYSSWTIPHTIMEFLKKKQKVLTNPRVINYVLANLIESKHKMVAWFVSNCNLNERMKYAQDMMNYIPIDVYGTCGPLNCPITGDNQCGKMLKQDYKFYLSFENSQYPHYITEKFFENGLRNDLIPIVLGARPNDYRKVGPPHSFIHVDEFESPAHLSLFLYILDANPILYATYLGWKYLGLYDEKSTVQLFEKWMESPKQDVIDDEKLYQSQFIDTKFWCRVCAMLNVAHYQSMHRTYPHLDVWWNET